MRVSFGRGTTGWRNHGPPTALVEELREDIERFAKTLRAIERFEALYAFVSVERALRWHGHSKAFRDRVVYATTALFFGTGNCTKKVSSVVLARVFNDDRLRLYDYDPVRFMSEAPKMFAFPRFDEVYGKIGERCGDEAGRSRSARAWTRSNGVPREVLRCTLRTRTESARCESAIA